MSGQRLTRLESAEDWELLVSAIRAMDDGARFEMTIVPGDASADIIAEFLVAMSEVHRSVGGRGLKFEGEGTEVVVIARTADDDAIEDLIRPRGPS